MRRLWSVAIAALALATCAHAAQEPVQLGAGSYLDAVPAGRPRPANGAQPVLAPGFEGPPPTSTWFSSLLWPGAGTWPLHPHPLALLARPDGLGVSYLTRPALWDRGYAYRMNETTTHLVASLSGLAGAQPRVAAAGDWSATLQWSAADRDLRATCGRGLPFVYLIGKGGRARVERGPHAPVPRVFARAGGALGLQVGDAAYGIFAAEGRTWDEVEGAFESDLPADGAWALAVLPRADAATLERYAAHAFAAVTGTRLAWDVAGSDVRATYTFETEARAGTEQRTPLVALFRHQYLHTDAPLNDDRFVSARGELRGAACASFEVALPSMGLLPVLPGARGDREVLAALRRELAPAELVPRGDVYWNGKTYGRLADLAHLAEHLDEHALRARIITVLAAELEDWLTASGPEDRRFLAYDATWHTLLAYPDAYGSAALLNDHHFHTGYYLQAAAAVARFEPGWVARYGALVDLLARDVAEPRRASRFPFLRSFDPYAGHSWASANGAFPDGNNQESSSEAVHFAAGLLAWGAARGDRELHDLGAFLLASETLAQRQYWLDVDDAVFPASMQPPVAGMVWDNGASHQTWFSAEPEAVHGINMLPLGPASLHLVRNPAALLRNLAHLRAQLDGEPRNWRDLFHAYHALADAPAAQRALTADARFAEQAAGSPAAARHMVAALTELGPPDPSARADITSFAVFRRPGTTTYAAFNPGSTARTVRFGDGHTLLVPPRELATESVPSER